MVVDVAKGDGLPSAGDQTRVLEWPTPHVPREIRRNPGPVRVALLDVDVPPRLFRVAQAVRQVQKRLRAQRLRQGEGAALPGRTQRGEELAPKDRHGHAHRQQEPVAYRLPLPIGGQATARHQTVDMGVEHERLPPGMQRRNDPRLRAKVFRIRQEGGHGVTYGLKQECRHQGDLLTPQRIEVVGDGKDDMGMIAGEEAGALRRQPALDLDERALGAGAMPTGVVPDTADVAVGAGLDMAAAGRRTTLQDGVRGFAYVGGQGMRLLERGIRVLKNGLECNKRHGRPHRLPGVIGFFFYSITSTIPAASGSSNAGAQLLLEAAATQEWRL